MVKFDCFFEGLILLIHILAFAFILLVQYLRTYCTNSTVCGYVDKCMDMWISDYIRIGYIRERGVDNYVDISTVIHTP